MFSSDLGLRVRHLNPVKTRQPGRDYRFNPPGDSCDFDRGCCFNRDLLIGIF